MSERRRVEAAASELLQKLGVKSLPETLVVLGSGFREFAKVVKNPKRLSFRDVGGMPSPGVAGHGAEILVGSVVHKKKSIPITVFTGRVHLYEGFTAQEVVFPLRAAFFAGVRRVLLTNATGGLDPKLKPGSVVAVRDQMNFTGHSCLIGGQEFGEQFVDPAHSFDAKWHKYMTKMSKGIGAGVYIGALGPAYETVAEAKYFRKCGGHVIGMSTVQEVMAAKQLGMTIGCLSFVSNMSGGIGNPVGHGDVLALVRKHSPRLVELISEAVGFES